MFSIKGQMNGIGGIKTAREERGIATKKERPKSDPSEPLVLITMTLSGP